MSAAVHAIPQIFTLGYSSLTPKQFFFIISLLFCPSQYFCSFNTKTVKIKKSARRNPIDILYKHML